ncbi:mannitol dehydrogenase family protein [Lactobacillus sp. ESL0731]|uniref:mannitol dehydrogenase family protein n=1 Tax=unclassified Lactobacillus TaxID=2620435 RepID=UPI0023F9DB09|nr:MULTISPECIES: mannitol dehydrogenase family protein [unclassified Lactobacillus]WEV51093.1 mannitol dehydrogenase family protein [Lactobacillus sp. ESL0700]WEV62222.1 mannitol dehydrogenase family protein [Lactobacillus sp. ESL0731]
MLKLSDNYLEKGADFAAQGITVPQYDQAKITAETKENPVWVHFGGGNLFRCFHAKIAQDLLNQNELSSGVVVAETYDDEVIDKIYHGYQNRMLSVVMNSDGSLEKELLASVGESLYFNHTNPSGWNRLTEIFTKPSLQFATFSITEKGYALTDVNGNLIDAAQADIENGPDKPQTNMGAIAHLLYARYQAGKLPIAMVSTDNFSQNGLKLETEVLRIAEGWANNGLVDSGFIDYLKDPKQVSFPWTMIDRITPNPAQSVADELKASGFADTEIVHTTKHTNIAPFGNTEKIHYLVIEDSFPNGRPALEKAGVMLASRDTVNDADQMKVTACLNPLHTALAIYGNLLGYTSIAAELADEDLLGLIKNLGYGEDLPVVKDPKIINPKKFIDELINLRLPNKNIPDTPQRIASDTSQKIPVRYGVTLQHYIDDPKLDPTKLEFIPLVLAGWCRYLMGIDDNGAEFTQSRDPLLADLKPYVADIKLGDTNTDIHKALKPILTNDSIFGNDLYQVGIADKVENYFKQLIAGKGAVRSTLHETIKAKSYQF